MQAKIPRSGALEVVQAAQAVTSGSSRADISSAQNILIEADEKGVLRLSVTDYETSMRAVLPGEASAPGRVIVPVDRVADILRESDGDEADLVAEGAHLHVSLPGAKYKVFGADSAEFPEIPDLDPSGGVEVPAEALRQMLLRTRYSAASERSRYTLNSVRWEHPKDGTLRLIGCDGHRLAMADIKASGSLGEPALVPLKAIAAIEKVLAAAPEDVAAVCRTRENRLEMGVGETRLGTLLLEGTYPDYMGVIPNSGGNVVTIDPNPLLRAVRQAALLADKASRTVRVNLREGRMVLSATSAGAGGGEAEVEVGVSYAGPDTDLVFNPDFLFDILRASGGEAVELDTAGGHAVRIGVENWLNVIMPVDA